MTWLFVDAYGLATQKLDFMARIQLVPAFLSLNIAAIAILVVLTLIFGRLYCSVICPLGIFQDIIARIRRITAGGKKRRIGIYKYTEALTSVRIVIFTAFIIVILLGLLNIMAISLGAFIEPYSAFGRIVAAFVSPLYDVSNNYLAAKSAEADEFAFTFIHRSTPLLLYIIAAVTFIVVAVFAWIGGRTYCNTICPVGTLLGFASKLSFFKIRIDHDKCNRCGSCARHCKSGCIDSKSGLIDYTRCVDCFNCIGTCRQNALHYAPVTLSSRKQNVKEGRNINDDSETPLCQAPDSGRRRFMASLAIVTGAILATGAENIIEKTTDGGLTPLRKRSRTRRKVSLLPPGVVSQAHINSHCVGCQLCIQACPDNLLTMSTKLETLMQPVLDYETDYCKPECSRCSNVCPAGVFKPLDEVMKTSWKVGTASVNLSQCISANGYDNCGNCARHCPASAIEMIEREEGGVLIPVVNENICIGCGACEVHCPVGTVASMESDQPAIHVEGVSYQRSI